MLRELGLLARKLGRIEPFLLSPLHFAVFLCRLLSPYAGFLPGLFLLSSFLFCFLGLSWLSLSPSEKTLARAHCSRSRERLFAWALAGIAVGTLGTILGFVIPTESTTIIAFIETNTCSVSSENRLKLFAGIRAKAWYNNIRLYQDTNTDGLADTFTLVDATIDYNENIEHFAILMSDNPPGNDQF
jgi:hypothetical protein